MTRLWPAGQPIVVRQTSGQVADPASPASFVWQGTTYHIANVCNRWRLHTRWWDPDQTVWREYLKVITCEGILCLLYQDLLTNAWFLARIYD